MLTIGKGIILAVGLVLGSRYSRAQDMTVVTATGKGLSEDEAFQNAREVGMIKSGVRLLYTSSEIESGTEASVTVFRNHYVQAIATGVLAGEDTVECGWRQFGTERPYFEATLRMKIRPLPPRDKYFEMTATLNPTSQIYRPGEEVSLVITATKDCYVTVLCIASDNSLYLAFPNFQQSDNHLESWKSVTVEGLEMVLLPGMTRAAEQLLVIGTKKEFPFVRIDDPLIIRKQNNGYVALSMVGAATKLAEWLTKLGEDQWAVTSISYSIVK